MQSYLHERAHTHTLGTVLVHALFALRFSRFPRHFYSFITNLLCPQTTTHVHGPNFSTFLIGLRILTLGGSALR